METLDTAIYAHAPVALGRRYTFRPARHDAADPFAQSLTDTTQALTGQPLRQASRFIRLAAAGALSAAQKADIPAKSGLYLATGLGDHHTAARLFAQSHPEQGRASPFDFVNVNSNTASYYIARIARLKGPNLTISQGMLSYEWALRLATADVRAGLTHALIGGTDERAATRTELERRLPRNHARIPGEGSGWLVLSAEPRNACARLLAMDWFADPSMATWRDLACSWTQLAAGRALALAPGPGVRQTIVTTLLRKLPTAHAAPYLARCGHYPTAVAFGTAEGLGRPNPAPDLWGHISAGPRRRYVLTLWERFGS